MNTHIIILYVWGIFMAVGPILGYIPQYIDIKRSRHYKGFSSFICFILLTSNILRVMSFVVVPYDPFLLAQSIFMIIVQHLLLHLIVKLTASDILPVTQTSGNEPTHSLLTKDRRTLFGTFWAWKSFLEYEIFLIMFTVFFIVVILIEKFILPFKFPEKIYLYLSALIESTLCMPQVIMHRKKKSTIGLNKSLVASWIAGDIFKFAYYLYSNSEVPFKLCAGIQLFIDFFIIFQIFQYRERGGSDQKISEMSENLEISRPSSTVPLKDSVHKSKAQNVCCLGAGYVGGPTCAVIADKCPHITVNVVDLNEERIRSWNEGPLPIHEPGLEEIVARTKDRNLFFTTDVASAIEAADIIFISVNTPTKIYGKGAGSAADLTAVESAAKAIMKYSRNSKVVVEKSTVPCGTANALKKLFQSRENESDIRFEIVSNPEFLAEGTAISDLVQPDRVLIGGFPTPHGKMAQQILADIYSNWVPFDRICTTNVWSSELTKLAANAMLAQRVSSINSISAVCEKTGADIKELANVLGKDNRIGSKFLRSGLGFGGSCFLKDILNLCYLSEALGLPEVSLYWRQVIDMNNFQRRRFIDNILETMFGTVRNKKITVFGFAFKKNTADTRESPAIDVIGQLIIEGAIVNLYDPLVKAEQAISDLKDHGYSQASGKNFIIHNDPYEACDGSNAIVTCTEWDEFRNYDYEAIYSMMSKPAYIFDGRLVLDEQKLTTLGFQVYSIGKGHYN